MSEPARSIEDEDPDVGESSLKILLNTPAVAPLCFQSPERNAACADCGLRLLCYQRHAETDDVHLLPRPRIPK